MIDQYKQLASDIVEYGKKLGADQVSTSLVNAVSDDLGRWRNTPPVFLSCQPGLDNLGR